MRPPPPIEIGGGATTMARFVDDDAAYVVFLALLYLRVENRVEKSDDDERCGTIPAFPAVHA
jgi:hypothetical protein